MHYISWRKLIELLETNNLLVFADMTREDIIFRSLAFDSRQLMKDGLFFCKGARFKKEYLDQAQENGAVAYLSENEIDNPLPHAIVLDMQRVMALVAETFYGYPQHLLRTFGVTGTNGKTTVVYHLVNILQAAYGQRPAFTSTVDSFDGKSIFETELTTPESLVIYKLLAYAGEIGIKNCVIECTAGGEEAKRLENIRFDYGVFTNITLDHISPREFHNFEEYLSCKMDIVRRFNNAVINADDPHSSDAIAAAVNAKRIVTYSVCDNSGADVFAKNIFRDGHTMHFTVVTPIWERKMTISRLGLFNVSNALAACAVAYLLELDADTVVTAISLTAVPGRMEYYEHNGYRVFVDYGHNKGSVSEVCKTIKEIYPDASLKIVFGCAGSVGLQRRMDVPQGAAPYCTHMYVTSDDSLYESHQDITDEIAKNVRSLGCPCTQILSREECVRTAVAQMTKEDVLLVTSKGADKFVEVCGKKMTYPGDDVIVQEALSQRK